MDLEATSALMQHVWRGAHLEADLLRWVDGLPAHVPIDHSTLSLDRRSPACLSLCRIASRILRTGRAPNLSADQSSMHTRSGIGLTLALVQS